MLLADSRKSFKPLALALVRHVLPGNGGLGVAVAGLLPTGWFPTAPLGRFPGVEGHESWPDGLWNPAVRVSDGGGCGRLRARRDRCMFDAAVEASSAVPGMFLPRQIGESRYVDGGIASPTHADLAVEVQPDLVIISSPLTRPSRRPMALLARRRLEVELAELKSRGIPTLVIEPPAEANSLFRGFPRRDPDRAKYMSELAGSATRTALVSGGPITLLA